MRELKTTDIEWLGDIPVNWDIHSLKRVLSNPITDGPHETPFYMMRVFHLFRLSQLRVELLTLIINVVISHWRIMKDFKGRYPQKRGIYLL